MVNEARYGLTYTLNNQAPPWEHPDETIRSAARDLMLPGGTNARSGNEYLALVNSASGNVAINNGFMGTYVVHKLPEKPAPYRGRHSQLEHGQARIQIRR
jgi:hypothetical protein